MTIRMFAIFSVRQVLLAAAVFAFIAAVAWFAVLRPPQAGPLELERLRIGYAVEAPYAFLTPEGEPTGESLEIARRIAAQLGIRRVEWILTTFDSLIPGLESKRFDLVAAGMFVTPERAKVVAFSRPTFHVEQALLVRRGNPRNLHSYADAVRHEDIKIAVIAGAIEESILARLRVPRDRLVVLPDALTGQTAVAAGIVDGLALSSPTIRWMAANGELGETEMAVPFRQPNVAEAKHLGYGAFAFRPQNRRLLAAWNAALARFVGSAEHLQLVGRFGFTRQEVADLPTVDEILSK
jgi:polar amino acid transport system substrate-binding protein